MSHDVILQRTNTRTEILFAPEDLLDRIDSLTSYQDQTLQGTEGTEHAGEESKNAWDGVHHFLRRPTTKPAWVPAGLHSKVEFCCQRIGASFRIEDIRRRPEEDIPHFFDQIPMWEHQEAANKAMDNEPSGVIVMPPRSGKTRTLLERFRRMNQPTLWVAPTNAIVEQTVLRAREWFPEREVQRVGANPEEQKHRLLWITTAAAAKDISQELMLTREALVLDEDHHFLANNSWGGELLKKSEHIFYRYGMTGTFFRSSGDDLALEAFLSRKIYEISTTELMLKGRIVPTKMAFLPIVGPRLRGIMKSTFHGPQTVGDLGIHTHEYRNQCASICAAHLSQQLGRTVLILVGTKKQGYMLQNMLRTMMPSSPMGAQFDSVEFISTDVKRPIQRKILDSFTNAEAVKILIGTSLVGEGVDLPNADALIYARGEKAAVTLVQSWFRVCTAYPGKQFGIIIDFADLHHQRLTTHSRGRWAVAIQEPTFHVSYLEQMGDFEKWAATAVS